MTAEEANNVRVLLKKFDDLSVQRKFVSIAGDSPIKLQRFAYDEDEEAVIREMLQLGQAAKLRLIDEELARIQINTSGATESHKDPGPRRVIT